MQLVQGNDSPGTPARGTRAGGRQGGEGQLRGRGRTDLLKMAALEANNIAHLPGKTGAARGRRSGSRETQRNHGETFSARAGRGAQEQRPRALQPSAAQQPRGGERPPRVRSPLLGCGGSHFQEFPRSVRSCASRMSPPSRAGRRRSHAPVRAPPRPSAAFWVAAARRAPPGGVEPAATRAARGGRTGGCC